MRFILTEYQKAASDEVVRRLRQFTTAFETDGDYAALSLTAPTGAGKTVIATSVVERLFFGDDDAAPDTQAVVLWVTDNPSLNEQTKRKMLMASSELKPAHLVTIDTGFDAKALAANRVYFLNIQKLGKTATTVQSGTDARTFSLWETIGNSFKAFKGHIYVVIDEAHRGTGAADRSRPTIVKRIISDPEHMLVPAPIVWGISATPERFDQAMAEASSPERTRRTVKVDPADVRESGLLKDVLDIRHPNESQPGSATLTKLAATNLKMMSERWDAYSADQDEPPVSPVLVVQVPAQVTDAVLKETLAALKESWPVLTGNAIGHAFDTHGPLNLGSETVRYVAPEDIQDDTAIRVVLFKEALTTGWDCPRAETMLSFRRAEDYTYIAQLIGRMVRTPLARRVLTDDVLNSVSLFLPHFDKASVQQVVDKLSSDPTSPPVTAVVNGVECVINPAIEAGVVEAIRAIPTYIVPGKAHRSQVARLHQLAMLLAGDELVERALTVADKHLFATIERERERLNADGTFDSLVKGLGRIDIGRVTVTLGENSSVTSEEHAAVAAQDIESVFRAANRGFRDRLAKTYWAWLLEQRGSESDAEDFLDPDNAKIEVAALASDPTVVEAVENAAEELVRRWLRDHSLAISGLPAADRAKYTAVRAQAIESEETDLTLPSAIKAGMGDAIPWWPKHLYTDVDRGFPATFNDWETEVLNKELARPSIRGWYRNPTGGDRAIRVPFRETDWDKAFYPDFIFVHETAEGLKPSIVDPHNYALADALPKWRGLAAYAEKHGDQFQRIDAVIKNPDGQLLRLDLLNHEIRTLLGNTNSQVELLGMFAVHGSIYS